MNRSTSSNVPAKSRTITNTFGLFSPRLNTSTSPALRSYTTLAAGEFPAGHWLCQAASALVPLKVSTLETGQYRLRTSTSFMATHGFFLTDQEFKRTNGGPALLAENVFGLKRNSGTRWNASLPENEWENPMVRCGIALAGANHFTNSALPVPRSEIEDGLLTGLEASLLNLQGTELVILSACESGAGEVKIGEGVMSLRRAFRIAGAETVLASHWKVSDKATSQLMTEFMRRWRAGEPCAKAWREAQLELLRSKDFSNPYFWAAFTLTGQWR